MQAKKVQKYAPATVVRLYRLVAAVGGPDKLNWKEAAAQLGLLKTSASQVWGQQDLKERFWPQSGLEAFYAANHARHAYALLRESDFRASEPRGKRGGRCRGARATGDAAAAQATSKRRGRRSCELPAAWERRKELNKEFFVCGDVVCRDEPCTIGDFERARAQKKACLADADGDAVAERGAGADEEGAADAEGAAGAPHAARRGRRPRSLPAGWALREANGTSYFVNAELDVACQRLPWSLDAFEAMLRNRRAGAGAASAAGGTMPQPFAVATPLAAAAPAVTHATPLTDTRAAGGSATEGGQPAAPAADGCAAAADVAALRVGDAARMQASSSDDDGYDGDCADDALPPAARAVKRALQLAGGGEADLRSDDAEMLQAPPLAGGQRDAAAPDGDAQRAPAANRPAAAAAAQTADIIYISLLTDDDDE